MTFSDFILHNIAPIAGLIYLLIVLGHNEALTDWQKKQFYILWIMEATELIVYNAERVTAAWSEPGMLRILLSAIGYSLRPAIVCVLIRLVCRNCFKGWKAVVFLFPELLAILCAFSAFFTDLVYSYDAANQFHRGPLGYSLHIILTVYLILFTVIVFQRNVLEEREEKRVMILAAVYVILTMIAETAFSLYGIGRTAIVFSTVFFVSALQTTKLKETIHALEENEELKLTLNRLETAQQELLHNRSIMQALGEDYLTVIYADLEQNEVQLEKIEESYNYFFQSDFAGHEMTYVDLMETYARTFVVPKEQEEFLLRFKREELLEILADKTSVTARFNCHDREDNEFCVEYHIIRTGNTGFDGEIIIGLRNVEEQVRKEREQMEAMSQALEYAREANAAKSVFLSRMSHDIRTPLNGILGLLEIGERHGTDIELMKSNREKARVAANHLLALINDVLDMSKLEDGTAELACEPFSLSELFKEIFTINELKAQEKGIILENNNVFEEIVCPYVYGSPLHVKQIFMNITSNAIKYNKPDGKVWFSADLTQMDEKHVLHKVIIQDTGIGMSPEYLEHLFEPFSQENSDARSVYEGTGLGMAISKSLVEKMGGNIEVKSTLGEGSTFIVCIPYEIAEKSDIQEDLVVPEEVSIKGTKILLAEDNELNAEIAVAILEDLGAVISLVHNGRRAVEAFEANEKGAFDVILMDVMMPEMNGLEAAKTIRNLDRPDAKSIPIIAMTANAFAEDVKNCLDAGMNDHLSKPLDVSKLTQVIAHYRRINNRL